jgi:hypothetical protein
MQTGARRAHAGDPLEALAVSITYVLWLCGCALIPAVLRDDLLEIFYPPRLSSMSAGRKL